MDICTVIKLKSRCSRTRFITVSLLWFKGTQSYISFCWNAIQCFSFLLLPSFFFACLPSVSWKMWLIWCRLQFEHTSREEWWQQVRKIRGTKGGLCHPVKNAHHSVTLCDTEFQRLPSFLKDVFDKPISGMIHPPTPLCLPPQPVYPEETARGLTT